MRHAGATVFLIFFGISVLDALQHGPWVRAAFWLALGLAFLLLDRARKRSARSGAR